MLVDLDDPEWNQKVGDFSAADNLNDRDLALAFAVRDNIDAEGVDVRVEITWTGSGQEVWNRTGFAGSMSSFQWSNYSAYVSSVVSKSTDVPVMLELEGITFESGNSYTIKIMLSQDGDPWDLSESETHRFVISP